VLAIHERVVRRHEPRKLASKVSKGKRPWDRLERAAVSASERACSGSGNLVRIISRQTVAKIASRLTS